MITDMINIFAADTSQLSLRDVLLSFLVALTLSIMVYVSYGISHSCHSFSARFSKYLVMLSLISALVINVVGGGIGISLAAIGIFSLMRVKETVNDTGNSAYILWSMAIGICCGVKQYTVAVIGSSIIFVFSALLENVRENENYVLVIKGNLDSMQIIEDIVNDIDFDNLQLKVKNTDSDGVEYIFEITENIMNNDKSIRLEKLLWRTKGVSDIRFLRQGGQYAK